MKTGLLLTIMCFTVTASAEGLKKVNYQNETSDTKSQSSPEAGSLSAEDAKKMMADIEVIKKKQAEQQKALEELEKEE